MNPRSLPAEDQEAVRSPVLGPRTLFPAAVVVGVVSLAVSAAYWCSGMSYEMRATREVATEARDLTKVNRNLLDEMQARYVRLETFRDWVEALRNSNGTVVVPKVLR